MTQLSLADMRALRYMTPEQAVEFFNKLDLSAQDRAQYEPLVGRSLSHETPTPRAEHALVTYPSVPNLPRRYMFTTLWLLGASTYTIARLFSVTQQAVYKHVNRTLPAGHERHNLRLNATLSPEAVEWYRDRWLEHFTTLETFDNAPQMAAWLQENYPYGE